MSKNQELSYIQNYHKQHPTDFIHGLLSSHVYIDSREGDTVRFTADINSTNHQYDNSQYNRPLAKLAYAKEFEGDTEWRTASTYKLPAEVEFCKRYNELLTDWYVHTIRNEPASDNYYSVLYVNDTTNQAVLAHRGTDIIGSLKGQNASLKADFIEVFNKGIGLQQTAAYASTKDAVDIVNNKKCNLSLTGHSLGAWLAELSVYFCHVDFGYDHVKAVTFDSPGTKNQMKNYKSNIKNKDTKIGISEFDIVTYLSAPNLVNVCNEHMGKVYRLFPEIPPQSEALAKVIDTLPKFISNNRVYLDTLLTISGHSLDLMLATFDSSSGKPKAEKYREVLDWPSIQDTPSQSGSMSAISKLMTTTTYGSLATVIVGFLSGDIKLTQLFETYKYLDITKHDLGYPEQEN